MYKIPQEKIEEVRGSISVVHYISQFVNLKKEGINFKGLCPFHQEKTPSFVVNPKKQFYHCFGCGKGGSLYTFIMDYEKLSFVEAVQKAADFAGISLPKQEERSPEEISHTQKLYLINEQACSFFEKALQQPENKQHLAYYKNRSLSENTISTFRLGYAPNSYDSLLQFLHKKGGHTQHIEALGLIQAKNSGSGHYVKFRQRMMFPFFNLSGKIIGFGGRKIDDEQQPKYLNSPESEIYLKSQTLYGLNHAIQAIREKDYVLIVEGYFDLLRLVDSGIKNVVASSGTALSEKQARLLGRYTKHAYIAYDGDGAGIKAAIRNAHILENQELNAYIVPMPEKEDPDTYILNYGKEAFEALIKQKVLPIQFQLDKFLKENPQPTLQQKDAFISEIIKNLAEFKSTIKTGLYVHHLADKMQVSESMLVSEVNRVKKAAQRYNKMRMEAREENKTDEKVALKPVLRGAHKAEEGLIDLLINSESDVQNYVLEMASFDLFENEAYQSLYSFIIEELEEHGKVDNHKLFELPELDEVQREILTKLTMDTQSMEVKYARDCIFQLKKWQLEKQARQISQHIKAEADSADSIMHYTLELAQTRKEIQKLEKSYREESKHKPGQEGL